VQVVLVGDSRVGKSSLLAAFAAEKFDATYAPTVGVNFKSRTVRIDDGDGYIGTVKLTVWDSAGASSSPLEHVPASPIDCVAQTLGPTQALTCVSFSSVSRPAQEKGRIIKQFRARTTRVHGAP
jgi:hypothetical protein